MAPTSDLRPPTSDLRLPTSAFRLHPSSFILHPSSRPSAPRGFTLIELLITILIIGILASIALAGLNRARQAANVANTKSTIAKLHSQIQMKWDSYRTRKVPIDSRALLLKLNGASPPPQAAHAFAFIKQLQAQRSIANDPLGVMPNDPLGRFPTLAQIAAINLLAMRELQRYEMPCGWGDLVAVDANGNPAGSPPYQLLGAVPTANYPYVLASPPSLAYQYVRKLNAAASTPSPAAGAPPSAAQLGQFDTAECLYMLVTSGLEDVAFGGAVSVPKSVGDADGDGLPEFQDAWTLGELPYPVVGAQRQPISWIRWPSGFHNYTAAGVTVSDLDQDPNPPAPLNAYEFAMAYHDYFDTLKVDVPLAAGPPRAYNLMPLVFSAGPDGDPGLLPSTTASVPWLSTSLLGQWINGNWGVDPYFPDANGPIAGRPTGAAWTDNIHNHLIEAR